MLKKQRDSRPYVGLHKEVIFGCQEWAKLSPRGKCLYLLLKGKRNPAKNSGNVHLSYREISKLNYAGLRKPKRIRDAFQELEKAGWIRRDGIGGGLYGKRTEYQLTGQFDEYGIRQ